MEPLGIHRRKNSPSATLYSCCEGAGKGESTISSTATLQNQGYWSLYLILTPGPDSVAVMTYIPVRFEDVGYSLDGHTHTHTHIRTHIYAGTIPLNNKFSEPDCALLRFWDWGIGGVNGKGKGERERSLGRIGCSKRGEKGSE